MEGRRVNNGKYYLLLFTIIHGSLLILYTSKIAIPILNNDFYGKIFYISLFYLIYINFFISMICCVKTNPGSVPPNWGFYMGEDSKRRRYCKTCNVWKPVRTHHCSVCNTCILNMDHHCPWINNCIGFKNRRYFVQMLIFMITLLLGLCFQCLLFYSNPALFGRSALSFSNNIIVTLMLLFAIVILFGLLPFIRFHIILITRNLTTIEYHDPAYVRQSPFDLGIGHNLRQVFGKYPICWLNPIISRINHPIGDGLYWGPIVDTNNVECPPQYAIR